MAEASETERAGAPALPEPQEVLLADRVEVAARILTEASLSSLVREKLAPAVRSAVDFLMAKGNPITQLKMLRACVQTEDPQILQATRKALESRSGHLPLPSFVPC